MIDVEKCEMVSIDVSKSHLCLVCLLFGLSWSNKDLGNCEREREKERGERRERIIICI